MITKQSVKEALELLDIHHEAFWRAAPFATKTGHPVPSDSRGWSQIIVSTLTGISGLKRQKGQDLADGSDVKAANTWEAIDTPRFNGVIKAGTRSAHSGKLTFLDSVPYIFFALWDHDAATCCRFRLWLVRPQVDPLFRAMSKSWYDAVVSRQIISTNFQLHPPRNQNHDVIRNTFGNFNYPLLFRSIVERGRYRQAFINEAALRSGLCTPA
jgi:hypothetical protein